jgi:N-acetylmuramoyl-L-alanine amidase
MRKNRGAKEDNLSVLRNTRMPSALAEVMFLDNPEERALLLQDSTKQQAAEAIATGIQNFMQR